MESWLVPLSWLHWSPVSRYTPSVKGMVQEMWIAKMKEIESRVKELITFCPFSPIPGCAKKLPNFEVMHVDLTYKTLGMTYHASHSNM